MEKLGNNYICVNIFTKINAQIETEIGKDQLFK